MIVKIFNKNQQLQSSHSFKEKQVVLGRNPKIQNSVQIDAESVSRNHLKISIKNQKLRIEDLGSKNGTFLNGEQISKNQKIQIKNNDRIQLAQFQGYIVVSMRNNQKNNTDTKAKKQKSNSSESQQSSVSEDERERSRQKIKQKQNSIQIAESTLKMLRSMTADKKSKAQKIKFLKLMGYPQAEQCWDQIQEMIKSKKTYFLSNANKKASQQLQKQFSQSRSGHQKRGLGK